MIILSQIISTLLDAQQGSKPAGRPSEQVTQPACERTPRRWRPGAEL